MENFAVQLAAAAAMWSEDRLEMLEACRETCRNTCLTLGITMETQSFADLWIGITKAKVKMHGFTGDDITINGIGVPKTVRCRDLNHVNNLNVYQRKAMRDDLTLLQKLLSTLKDMYPSLVRQVSVVTDDLLALLS